MFHNTKDYDYKTTHFEYPELTRIHGEPTTKALITLQRQVRANAMSVNTTLGGGSHGHLGLVCSATVYAAIPGTAAYTRAPNPGALVIPQGSTQYEIAALRDTHAEETRLYREMLAVERTLIQQIVSAVDGKFLKAIRNAHTNKIVLSIAEIFDYLFDTYGDVTPEELSELYDTVKNMVFNPKEPVDTIFTEIEDLTDISNIAKNPITEAQKVNLAYLVLQRTGVFNSGLKTWNDKVPTDKTWDNCKSHFRNVQKGLRRTGRLTVEESMNHADLVNIVSEGVRDAMANNNENQEFALLSQENAQVKQELQSMKELVKQVQQQAANQMQQPFQNITNPTPVYQSQAFPNPYFANPTQPYPYFNPFIQQQQHTGQNNKYRGPKLPKQPRQYCWTHGKCAHNGTQCQKPAVGHRPEATFENTMGGSTRFMDKA